MHVLPAAGSAIRFSGIPKYLLPGDANGTSLLCLHIESALGLDIDKVVVMAHPTMAAYLRSYLSKYGRRLTVDEIESSTMTETIIQAVNRHGLESNLVSVTLPDTATKSTLKTGISSHISKIREAGNSLLLFPFQEKYRGKYGQVNIDPESKVVLEILDKTAECDFPFIWGGVSISRELLVTFDPSESTIGNCIDQQVKLGEVFQGVETQDEYYDCGNMSDYLQYLKAVNGDL